LTTQTICRKRPRPVGETQPEGESEGLQTSFESWIDTVQAVIDKSTPWERFDHAIDFYYSTSLPENSPGRATDPLQIAGKHN
jgi:hypothetical protein